MHRILFVLAIGACAWGQKFEVASIKPNHSGGGRIGIGMRPGGRFSAENVTPKQLISIAYGIRDYQLTGLPGWADSEHYDINAKPEGAPAEPEAEGAPNRMPTPEEMKTRQEKMRAMLQDLLADRFGLKIHRETKELPIYVLVVAKGGPKLEVSNPDAKPLIEPPPGAGNERAIQGGRGPMRGQMMRIGRGGITAQDIDMTMLATQLSSSLGRNVIDKTGLTGRYDVKLNWSPDDGSAAAAFKDSARPPDGGSTDSGPSIFTAVQEQLGLKLESQKGPVEIVVVDHVDRPSEN